MYKNLLVGYDGAEPSKAALREAALWVRKHGGEVTALHAIYFDSEEFSTVHNRYDERVKLGLDMCNEIKAEIKRDLGVEINTVARDGEPPAAILEVASKIGADLIVMGTYSRTGLKRLILGSVTAHVIINSSVDVLVVKGSRDEKDVIYKSLLLPFDGSEFSQKALKTAISIAKTYAATISTLYVIPRYEEMIEFFKTDGIQSHLLQTADKIVRIATDMIKLSCIAVMGQVLEGKAYEVISDTARDGQYDLIVMGSHGYRGVNRALLGSTAERVIIHATCPVLVTR